MVEFWCRECGSQLQAGEELTGTEVACKHCGHPQFVPIDLHLGGEVALPSAVTISMEEMRAYRV